MAAIFAHVLGAPQPFVVLKRPDGATAVSTGGALSVAYVSGGTPTVLTLPAHSSAHAWDGATAWALCAPALDLAAERGVLFIEPGAGAELWCIGESGWQALTLAHDVLPVGWVLQHEVRSFQILRGCLPLPAPLAAPLLSSAAGASGLFEGTYTLAYSWTTARGETGVGPSATIFIGDGMDITVALPSAPPAFATGWRVYLLDYETNYRTVATGASARSAVYLDPASADNLLDDGGFESPAVTGLDGHDVVTTAGAWTMTADGSVAGSAANLAVYGSSWLGAPHDVWGTPITGERSQALVLENAASAAQTVVTTATAYYRLVASAAECRTHPVQIRMTVDGTLWILGPAATVWLGEAATPVFRLDAGTHTLAISAYGPFGFWLGDPYATLIDAVSLLRMPVPVDPGPLGFIAAAGRSTTTIIETAYGDGTFPPRDGPIPCP